MGIFSGILVFAIVWWVVLFMVLPWGVRPHQSDDPEQFAGAPERPRLVMKMLVTTGIAVVVFAAIYFAVEADLITFRRGG